MFIYHINAFFEGLMNLPQRLHDWVITMTGGEGR